LEDIVFYDKPPVKFDSFLRLSAREVATRISGSNRPTCKRQGVPHMKIWAKLKNIGATLEDEPASELIKRISKVVYSNTENYVLRRDLSVTLRERPKAKIPIRVRPLEPGDVPQIIAEHPEGSRLRVLKAGLSQCYVAVTDKNEVCYMQWLIAAKHKKALRDFRSRDFYAFSDDTVLLEFAYMVKRFRGLGIMAPAMADIAEQDPHARWAITYVDRNNIASLRGCQSAGFFPYLLVSRKWRLFRLVHSIGQPDSLEPFWGGQTKAPAPPLHA
jgi:hypothetical protein